jgi:hypothetical protein
MRPSSRPQRGARSFDEVVVRLSHLLSGKDRHGRTSIVIYVDLVRKNPDAIQLGSLDWNWLFWEPKFVLEGEL